jgi:uncharacterized SAM-binding protein YcdF (DUF218 family)
MRLVRAARFLILLAVAGLVAGFVVFATRVVDASPPADPHAEGIVVLTGGSARIEGALHLLADGRAKRLLISGVNPAVRPAELADTLDPALSAAFACCVDLGRDARDTIGNATETRDWVARHGYASLIVVTSDYHMPRSLAELRDALPGVKLIPYPVVSPDLHLENWWRDPAPFTFLTREYGKYLLTAVRLAIGAPVTARAAAARGAAQ